MPYPYVSGPAHIGQGRTFTVADVIARFKRMMGYNVLYPIAWHVTGTPIQAISDMIARGDEETIRMYKSYVRLYIDDEREAERIVRSFSDSWNIVKFFVDAFERDFNALGLSMDFTRQFTTGDHDYSAFIIWQFHKLHEMGYIKRGKHVVLYSPAEGHAVGEHDIRGGDEITVSIIEFNLVKFKLVDENVYLVAATLRPETIFGVTNLWVNPDATYVLAEVNGERWVVSERASWKLSYQDKVIKVLRHVRGEELIGRIARAPIVDKVVPVLPALFIDDDTATGVVYSVPAHAPYDYAALRDLKRGHELARRFKIEELVKSVEPIKIIDVPGYKGCPAVEIVERLGVRDQLDRERLDEATKVVYRDEFYSGVMSSNTPLRGTRVSEARAKVCEMLRSANLLDRMYEIEPRRVYTRAGNRVIAAVIPDQWFIDYTDPSWKQRAIEHLRRMKIVPDKYVKAFEDTIGWLAYRPCARRRGIGTRLPWDSSWIIESLSDSTIYMMFYTIVKRLRAYGISDKLREYVTKLYQGDRGELDKIVKLFDYVILGIGDVNEVAKLYGVDPSKLEDVRREFEYWYPVDERHSGIDLVTNHLSFFIMHHVALLPEKYWPRSITLNEYVIREGRKMSKSLGNVLTVAEVTRRYSADLFRLYVAYAANVDSVLDWREDEVNSVLSRMMDFWSVCESIVAMGRPSVELEHERLSLVSRWLMSSINVAIDRSRKLIESYDLRSYAITAFFNVLSDVEKYMSISKVIGLPEDEVKHVLWYVLERWIKILQPLIPHVCEELWHRMGNTSYVVLERWPEVDPRYLSEDLRHAFAVVERTIEDVRSIVRARGMAGKRLHIYVGQREELYVAAREALSMICQGRSVRDVISSLVRREDLKHLRPIIPQLVNKIVEGYVPRELPSREAEVRMFRELSKYVATKLEFEEVVVQEAAAPSYDPLGRAKHALPGRPAVYIED